ncbi:MAG: DUF3553 domain-containing protein [Phycisphaerales bacterium]|nr:DUF3553 domain-containing protein [Phycisphaerales bacterium]
MSTTYKSGDRIRHANCPEWGAGVVLGVEPATHDGAPCQSLRIRFERAGLKTLSTGVAPLQPAPAESDSGDAAPQTTKDALERLYAVPDRAKDPFLPLGERLRNSLGLYRYTSSGSSLLDWAAAQTGLADPLSLLTRHDLESAFQRFRRNLDEHCAKVGLELVRSDPEAFRKATSGAPTDAQRVLQRLAPRR